MWKFLCIGFYDKLNDDDYSKNNAWSQYKIIQKRVPDVAEKSAFLVDSRIVNVRIYCLWIYRVGQKSKLLYCGL